MIHLLIADAKNRLQFTEKWGWKMITEPHAEKQSGGGGSRRAACPHESKGCHRMAQTETTCSDNLAGDKVLKLKHVVSTSIQRGDKKSPEKRAN